MIYYIAQFIQSAIQGTDWEEPLSFLRVFNYISFRSACAALTALVLSWYFGPKVVRALRKLELGQEYQDKAEECGGMVARIIDKTGTPTMGGGMVVLILDLSALLWARLNELVVLTLLSVIVLAALGFYDDYLKVTRGDSRGSRSSIKLWVQVLLALFIGVYLWRLPETKSLISEIMVPFYKYPVLSNAALVGLVITIFAIVGSSNAVNLTDGLDGLAIGCTLTVSFVYLVLTYVAGNVKISEYLQVPYVAGAGELTVFCAGMIGAGLGFLWYNCHPAQMFMGDTGSLALGGALGIIAVLIHQPFLLLIAGGVFVVEAVSVMMQRYWFKITRKWYGQGRRLFLMSPLHHHFEKLGWYESKIVTRFYIVSILFAIIALSTLKLR
ncbi:MAG: phospho-N-acetylmuramoyl-pentapeptide-transferase [Verrucomicrobia bacterium]|nr:phospho-N-acetylmuramoyl-pentapeptide-transferase [Verrucomicrobiota bacterium]